MEFSSVPPAVAIESVLSGNVHHSDLFQPPSRFVLANGKSRCKLEALSRSLLKVFV
jgi:hypothetical protein